MYVNNINVINVNDINYIINVIIINNTQITTIATEFIF
jgi:hypothetical protein